jgi:Asp-tRNA(Asn)/Glu-tRNA(Gln) amidotransferase A subunit family amidase
MGGTTSMPGQDGIPSVLSPMARTMGDLTYFTKSLLGMKPWRYDHTVHPIEWREDQIKDAREKKRLRIGILRDDGMLPALEFYKVLKANIHTRGHNPFPRLRPCPSNRGNSPPVLRA